MGISGSMWLILRFMRVRFGGNKEIFWVYEAMGCEVIKMRSNGIQKAQVGCEAMGLLQNDKIFIILQHFFLCILKIY
jgi:hypothetical protein